MIMQIVINISESLYERLLEMDSEQDCGTFNESALVEIIQSGVPQNQENKTESEDNNNKRRSSTAINYK